MIPFVLENAWGVLGMGLVFVLVAIVYWIQSGSKGGLILAIVGLLATGGLYGLSHAVVTEREALTAMLHETSDLLEQNRFDDVIARIHPRPSESVLQAKSVLNNKTCSFTTANIKAIHSIDFSGPESSRQAIVKMNVFVEATINNFQLAVPRYVELTMIHRDSEWKVQDFVHSEPFAGFKNGDANTSEFPDFR